MRTAATILESAEILLNLYLERIIRSKPTERFELMNIIKNQIYCKVIEHINVTKNQFIGEELGLEKMFIWYREWQDYNDGSRLLYYNDFSKNKQLSAIEENFLKEAIELYSKVKKNK